MRVMINHGYELYAPCGFPDVCFVRLVSCASDHEAELRARELMAERGVQFVEIRREGLPVRTIVASAAA